MESFVHILIPRRAQTQMEPEDALGDLRHSKEVNELHEELSRSNADVPRLGMKEDADSASDCGSNGLHRWLGGSRNQGLQDMVHNALDESFKDRNRAKEGFNSFGVTHYVGPSLGDNLHIQAVRQWPAGSSTTRCNERASRKAMKGKVLASQH